MKDLNNNKEEIKILENKLTAEEFTVLQEAVGFGTPNFNQTKKAIENSIYTLSAYKNDEIVGMGRLVGDGARNFYIQDLFIKPEFQKKGIGKSIVNKLLEYIRENGMKNCDIKVGLMAAKGKDQFYEKLGFRARPNDNEGSGMMINITLN